MLEQSAVYFAVCILKYIYVPHRQVQEALIDVVRTARPSLDGLYGHMFRMLSERLADLGLVGFNREKGQLFRVGSDT